MARIAEPVIIQGGMGVAVSSWQLARAVSLRGQLGVVSGTALDAVLARRLQDGDPGGHARRALEHFPVPDIAERVLEKYFREGGRSGEPYRPHPRLHIEPGAGATELNVVASFVEVWLAKQGHEGPVGINMLEKIQTATLTTTLGAMIAGVDYVLMGAGVPREIPQLLNDFAAGRPGALTIDVADSTRVYRTTLDPTDFRDHRLPGLKRPRFLAIVSLHVLAGYLARNPDIRPDGFVVEGPSAGGHSAPPRGRVTLDDHGDPVYSPKDYADLGKIAELDVPFWLAGGYGTPEKVTEALHLGACGVQVGTLFALAQESGLRPDLRIQSLDRLASGRLTVRNDPLASPTGFPFKVADLPGSLSDPDVYAARERLCDLGYLRTPFEKANGTVGYRCAAEPVRAWLKKGGDPDATVGRKCLCNALLANIGLAQKRPDGYVEQPLVTLGQDLESCARLLGRHPQGWSAAQALDWLLGSLEPHVAGQA